MPAAAGAEVCEMETKHEKSGRNAQGWHIFLFFLFSESYAGAQMNLHALDALVFFSFFWELKTQSNSIFNLQLIFCV